MACLLQQGGVFAAQFLHSGGTEAALPPLGLVERVHLHDGSHADAFENELGDSVPLLHLEVLVGEVEEHDAQRSAVVAVHHAGAHVDELLRRQTRARRYVSLYVQNAYRHDHSSSWE